MAIIKSISVGLLLGTVAEGFRVKPKRRSMAASGQTEAPPQISQEDEPKPPPMPRIDPSMYPSCSLADSDCSLRDMGKQATLIYPSKAGSKCWNGDEWAFLVHPGASDKLLFYFPGGGACWENPVLLPGAAKLCMDSMSAGLGATAYGTGAQDFSDPRNPFKDYTVVSPTYCGGGAHAANTTVRTLLGTRTRYQHDYPNDEDARVWTKKNMAAQLTNFVIAGSSAGALGAAVWADRMLSTFSYKQASVLLDSYVGVFPKAINTQGILMNNFGVCDTPNFQNHREKCENKTVELEDLLEDTIAKHPKVAFAHVQAKADLVQRLFYTAVGLSFFGREIIITRSNFYKTGNAIKQKMNRFPNYVNYMVDGSAHVFMAYDRWYTTGIEGQDTGSTGLNDWVKRFIVHERVNSECNGELKPNGASGEDYCDSALYPKTLRV